MLSLMLKLFALAGFVFGFVVLDSKIGPKQRPLSTPVHTFAVGCEHLLAALAHHEPLTDEEKELIKHYCKEVLEHVQQQDTPSAPKVNA